MKTEQVAEAIEAINEAAESSAVQYRPVKSDRRPLDQRPSACRVCGVATEPGDGVQQYAEKWRWVRGGPGERSGRESYDVPTWKTCHACLDEATGPRMWASWLGLTAPLNLDALATFAAEYPQLRRQQVGPTGLELYIDATLPTGPVRFDDDGGHPGAPGGRRWMHPGAVSGRRAAKARWRELIAGWVDVGSRHESGLPCGVCGRSHAWPAAAHRPTRPQRGVLRADNRVRWSQVRILGGKVACSVCFAAYRQRDGGGFAEGTVADWAAAQAAGLYPTWGLAEEIRFVLAYQRPGYAVADGPVRGPWEYLGPELGRLRDWAASLSEPGPGELPDLPVAGVLNLRPASPVAVS